jgi:Zn-dependent protease
MAILWGLIWKMTLMMPAAWEQIAIPILLTAKFGIFLNLILMVLNLLPLPPLDGGRVLTWLVPEPFAQKLDQLERYGIIILIGLLFFGLWEKVIHPVMGVISNLIHQLLGIQL